MTDETNALLHTLQMVAYSDLFTTLRHLRGIAFRPLVIVPPLILWMKSLMDGLIMAGMGLLLATVVYSTLYVKLITGSGW